MTFLKSIVGIFCLVVFSTNASAQLVWSAPIVVSDSGDFIGVDLSVSGYQNLISAQGTIRFDETILEYSHVDNFVLTSISSGSFGETEVNQGLLSFSWYESDLIGKDIADNAVVFTIYFTVIGSSEEVSEIELIDQPVVAEFVDEAFVTVPFTFETGSVTVSGVSALEESILEHQIMLFPNPAKDWLKIESSLVGADLEIHWYSMNGKFMKKDSFHNSGSVNVISTDGLNRGTYLLRVGNPTLGFQNQLMQVL